MRPTGAILAWFSLVPVRRSGGFPAISRCGYGAVSFIHRQLVLSRLICLLMMPYDGVFNWERQSCCGRNTLKLLLQKVLCAKPSILLSVSWADPGSPVEVGNFVIVCGNLSRHIFLSSYRWFVLDSAPATEGGVGGLSSTIDMVNAAVVTEYGVLLLVSDIFIATNDTLALGMS
jgi:hypothetical protein